MPTQDIKKNNFKSGADHDSSAVCGGCGAVRRNGRWKWEKAPRKTRKTICPACLKLHDEHPVGELEIKGPFFYEHREEVLELIHKVARQRDLLLSRNKILAVHEKHDSAFVKTTGMDMVKRMGKALYQSYQGRLYLQYSNEEKNVRVYWSR